MASRSPGKRAARAAAQQAAPENSVHPKSRAAWGRWLAQHHARTEGVWLVSYKKATGKPRFDYGEAVEEALRFGWVDSKPRALDAERAMLWFAPRKSGTGWSRANRKRIEQLMADGRMAPAGLAKVNSAKRDGSWMALAAVEALRVPPDLERALATHTGAAEYFNAFPPSTRRSILEWVHGARKPETRATRIEETARLAAQNIRANQWRQPSGRSRTPKK